ncbi:MAG TPA: RES family NAD+ phosphorylase [Syntrophales bacterium]|nr:RES family NAD+ phosphorylase [Syntrophales bacterium]
MILYRVAKLNYIKDLTGTGPRIAGSRWSPAGIPVIYTAESRALAAMEFYAHMKSTIPFPAVRVAGIKVPDKASLRILDVSSLPPDWKKYPAPEVLQEYGKRWVDSGKELLLQVPSVLVPHEFNYLINPDHPDMKDVKIISVEELDYDRFKK